MAPHPLPTPPAPAPGSIGVRAARVGGAALVLGLVAAATWFAWLGWDDEYHLVDGVAQGPYRAWQVIGCGVSLAVAAVAAYVWAREPWGIPVLAAAGIVGFAVPWTLHASSTDESGLFVVGLFFLLVGGGFGLTVLLGLTAAFTARPARGHR